jgi:hypothetical protein
MDMAVECEENWGILVADLKLFRIVDGIATELPSGSVALERDLQVLLERNLEAIFGVKFLASEYSTGRVHRGRIDSLGLDENGSPVILEYKRTTNENVINQGLFYLDWLMDHQAEFRILVEEQLGRDAAMNIDWSTPRLICVANDFTKYDEHAVRQIDRNVELVRYRDLVPICWPSSWCRQQPLLLRIAGWFQLNQQNKLQHIVEGAALEIC